jgi:predicted outer membrane repeat protein
MACGQSLQAALQLGGTILLCPGRYTGNFQIVAQDAVIIGAGDGSDPAQDTILDGNKNDRTLVVGLDRTAELHRLRITGGKTSDAGGGVRNDGKLTMTRCTVIQNEAALDGGGIFHLAAATGPLTVNDCKVEKNTGGTGGGIAAHSTRLCVVNDSLITGNKSMSNGGGAVVIGAMRVDRSTFRGNEAVDSGGGIYTSGTMTMNEGSAITNNSATTGGGGLFIQTGVCSLFGITVTGNTSAAAPGGGIVKNGGTVSLFDPVVSQNEPDNCVGITC